MKQGPLLSAVGAHKGWKRCGWLLFFCAKNVETKPVNPPLVFSGIFLPSSVASRRFYKSNENVSSAAPPCCFSRLISVGFFSFCSIISPPGVLVFALHVHQNKLAPLHVLSGLHRANKDKVNPECCSQRMVLLASPLYCFVFLEITG